MSDTTQMNPPPASHAEPVISWLSRRVAVAASCPCATSATVRWPRRSRYPMLWRNDDRWLEPRKLGST